jgi:hypothetical protein
MHRECSSLPTVALLSHPAPFFLAMAVVTLLYSLGVLPMGGNGWNLIGLVILAGATAFCCLPELIFGKYRTDHGEGRL